MIFGLRRSGNHYGNVATLEGVRFVAASACESDLNMEFKPVPFIDELYKNWPLTKGVSILDKDLHKGLRFQDYLTGTVYYYDGDALVPSLLTPAEAIRVDNFTTKLIPLDEEAINPQLRGPYNLREIVLTEDEYAYKVAPSGNRMYFKYDQVLIYNAIRIRQFNGSRGVKTDNWYIVKKVPQSVMDRFELLSKSEPKPCKLAEKKETLPELTLDGNAPPDKLLDTINSLAGLASKLIDSGRVDDGAGLAKKLGFVIGNFSWKLRGE